MRKLPLLLLSLVLVAAPAFCIEAGVKAPPINGQVWVGNPVHLDALKGNIVVLAFWNLDAPC
ncbi:MAG TPA: hypothetical protein VGP72_04490 [Planctomycetota bacterium]|jgi:hypothetical protein